MEISLPFNEQLHRQFRFFLHSPLFIAGFSNNPFYLFLHLKISILVRFLPFLFFFLRFHLPFLFFPKDFNAIFFGAGKCATVLFFKSLHLSLQNVTATSTLFSNSLFFLIYSDLRTGESLNIRKLQYLFLFLPNLLTNRLINFNFFFFNFISC